ncbi:MAG: ABC transporter ATP-binding protein [Bacillota bacterium]|nr:ABC transporter ATP-binding protein [Bacillota bacterium]MDD3297627.1 ABC transporter ATP-binding protein [Bacillota bacterium]MDD3850864.1 ABC transporter ATP-binding protein [Bacillota bacterium]MDD4707478.1 ABC transporter ATP-binding protein [Bacillota bacterium]
MPEKLLEVKNLKKYFKTKQGYLHAVDDVNFAINRGKTLSLVGESGCGKSTIGRVVLRLLEATAGEIYFEGANIRDLDKMQMRKYRKKMQIVFQDPYSSLDSRKSVYESIAEPLVVQKAFTNKKQYAKRVYELMDTSGLAQRFANAYPHELDGGRRQRVGIARALALNPSFIVLDEPVSALDVSIQAQVLNLLQQLQDDLNLTYLFISHDLSVVKHISDMVAVMYLGKIVELANCKSIFQNPVHPYTKALLSAVPIPKINVKLNRIILEGDVPSPINPKPGCRFAGRCRLCSSVCKESDPVLTEVDRGHFVSCFNK